MGSLSSEHIYHILLCFFHSRMAFHWYILVIFEIILSDPTSSVFTEILTQVIWSTTFYWTSLMLLGFNKLDAVLIIYKKIFQIYTIKVVLFHELPGDNYKYKKRDCSLNLYNLRSNLVFSDNV